jgi:signal peptidase I
VRAGRFFALIAFAAVFALLFLRLFFVGVSTIPQDGMYPEFPAGSHVVTLRHAYRKPENVQRGDVIAFLHRVDGVEYKFIWRVVGLPGDVIETRNGRLVVNGSLAEYLKASSTPNIEEEINASARYRVAFVSAKTPIRDVKLKVAAGTFFVMGDNRNNAADSRVYGLVPFQEIVGKAIYSW